MLKEGRAEGEEEEVQIKVFSVHSEEIEVVVAAVVAVTIVEAAVIHQLWAEEMEIEVAEVEIEVAETNAEATDFERVNIPLFRQQRKRINLKKKGTENIDLFLESCYDMIYKLYKEFNFAVKSQCC